MSHLTDRWAADEVTLVRDTPPHQVAAKPAGPATWWAVTGDDGRTLGLLWQDERGRRGYQPSPYGSPDAALAADYAWRVLAAGGGPERFAPMYRLREVAAPAA